MKRIRKIFPDIPTYGEQLDLNILNKKKINIISFIPSKIQFEEYSNFYNYLKEKYGFDLNIVIFVPFKIKGNIEDLDIQLDKKIFKSMKIRYPFSPFILIDSSNKVLYSARKVPERYLIGQLLSKYIYNDYLDIRIPDLIGMNIKKVFNDINFTEGFILVVSLKDMRCPQCVKKVKEKLKEINGEKMIIIIDRIDEGYIESFKRREKIGIYLKAIGSEYMEEYRDRLPIILEVKNGIITRIKEVL